MGRVASSLPARLYILMPAVVGSALPICLFMPLCLPFCRFPASASLSVSVSVGMSVSVCVYIRTLIQTSSLLQHIHASIHTFPPPFKKRVTHTLTIQPFHAHPPTPAASSGATTP